MAELADAAALGAVGRKVVQVQILFPAPLFRRTVFRRGNPSLFSVDNYYWTWFSP